MGRLPDYNSVIMLLLLLLGDSNHESVCLRRGHSPTKRPIPDGCGALDAAGIPSRLNRARTSVRRGLPLGASTGARATRGSPSDAIAWVEAMTFSGTQTTWTTER